MKTKSTKITLRNPLLIILPLILSGLLSLHAQDRTMIQGFYWDVSPSGVWYDSLAYYSEELGKAGFDGIWMPPPSKGFAGGFDVGYTPYDYYDLGNFNSQGTIPTRYGTRAQLENAINKLKAAGLEVYMDMVLNHRSGGSLEYNPNYNALRGTDDASNYSGWGGTNNQGGIGFGQWVFSTTGSGGSAGFFRGTSNRESREPIDTDGNAFGMFSNGGTGTGAFARRAFSHNADGELTPGESFSFDFSFRFNGGRRGIDLWSNSDGTGFLANVEHAGSDALTFFPGASNPANRETIVGNIFNKATRLTFIWNGGASDNLTIRAESLADNTFVEERTVTVSAPPKSFTLLFENTISGGDYEPFFNNFNISNTIVASYAGSIPKSGSTFFEFCSDTSFDCSQYPEGGNTRLTYTAFPLATGSGLIAWDPYDFNDPESNPGGAEFFYPNTSNNPGNTGDFYADNQLYDGTFGGFHQMFVNGFGYDNALHDGSGSTLPLGEKLKIWGDWLTTELGIDGYRFDFVKGIHPEYFKSFMNHGAMAGKFHVHELYDGDMTRKTTYLSMLNTTNNPFSPSLPAPSTAAIFDFNLRFTYRDMSTGGDGYDIRAFHNAGLFNNNVPYNQIVTFVENHDFDRLNFEGENTFTDGSHQPIIDKKILAYAHMLTHPGYAQVWWRDYFYYGLGDEIRRLVAIRNQFASGSHHILTNTGNPFWPGNATDDPNHVYVMQREGINDDTGLIMAINKHSSFNINVWVDVINKPEWCGKQLVDLTGTISGTIQVQSDCRVQIETMANSYSVFVPSDYTFELASAVLEGQEGYRMLSVPVHTNFATFLDPIWTQGAINGANNTGGTPNVYRWDVTADGKDVGDWLPVTDLSASIEPGTGIMVYVYDLSDNEDIDPSLATGFPKQLPAAGNEIQGPVSPAVNSTIDGWTLLGNPFSTAIDWSRVDKSASVGEAVYVWDVNDGGGFPSDPNLGAVGTWKTNVAGLGEFDGMIRPFQGFFVQTISDAVVPEVTFTNDSKLPGGNFFGKSRDREYVRLELYGENLHNSAWMAFSESGSFGRTREDALQLKSLGSQYAVLATRKQDGDLYDIGSYPYPDETFMVPIAIETTYPGEFTITVTDFKLPGNTPLFFVDRETMDAMPFESGFSYTFTTDATAKAVSKKVLSHPEKIQGNPEDGGDRFLTKGDRFLTKGDRFLITSDPNLTQTDREPDLLPQKVSLHQNYPNPFNPSTTIVYELPEATDVTIAVYDMLGRRVATLADGSMDKGRHQVTLHADGLSSGVYLYTMQAGQVTINRKLTIVK